MFNDEVGRQEIAENIFIIYLFNDIVAHNMKMVESLNLPLQVCG